MCIRILGLLLTFRVYGGGRRVFGVGLLLDDEALDVFLRVVDPAGELGSLQVEVVRVMFLGDNITFGRGDGINAKRLRIRS